MLNFRYSIVLICFFSAFITPNSQASDYKQTVTASGSTVSSRFTGNHLWSSGSSGEYAHGFDGTLTILTRDWPSKAKIAVFHGDVILGHFDGWVESYFHQERKYWLGDLSEMQPIGCGVSTTLDALGGRIDNELKVIFVPYRGANIIERAACHPFVQEKLARKAGKAVGQLLFDCIATKKPNCFSWKRSQ